MVHLLQNVKGFDYPDHSDSCDILVTMNTTFLTKKNRSVKLRLLEESDVESRLMYINEISAEDTYIGLSGEQLSFKDEKEYVLNGVKALSDGNELHLVAVFENKIVAVCDARMDLSLKKRSAHIAQLGLTVAKDFRGEGLGEKMMRQTIELIPEYLPDIKLLKLGVFAQNTVAIALYTKLGFKQYGMLPGGVLYRDQYIDHILMYKKV